MTTNASPAVERRKPDSRKTRSEATRDARSADIQAKRHELLDQQLAKDPTPNLRAICTLMFCRWLSSRRRLKR